MGPNILTHTIGDSPDTAVYRNESLSWGQKAAIYRAIIKQVNYKSREGLHCVTASRGAATYSVMGIKQLHINRQALSISPQLCNNNGGANDIMMGVVRHFIPGMPPLIHYHGFGWATYNFAGEEEIIHPFPLTVDIQTGSILNELDPNLYFRALRDRWHGHRHEVLASIMRLIIFNHWDLSFESVLDLRKKVAAVLNGNAAYSGYAVLAAPLVALGCSIANVNSAERPLFVARFNEWIKLNHKIELAEYFYQAVYGTSVESLKLPPGHVVFEMADNAASFMVARKLTG